MSVPIEENWRIGIMHELINTQNYVAGFTEEEMQEILKNVSSSYLQTNILAVPIEYVNKQIMIITSWG